MPTKSLSDKVITKLVSATLHDLGAAEVNTSQEYVLSLIRGLPWFYRIPFRMTAVCTELSALPFRLRRLSALSDANCQRFVRTTLEKTPLFPALHRLVRTFALMCYANQLTSAKHNRD